MSSIAELATFLGWCSVINIGLLVIAGIMVVFMREPVMKIHQALLGVSKEGLPAMYMEWIGRYKTMVIFFNVVPYFALKAMM